MWSITSEPGKTVRFRPLRLVFQIVKDLRRALENRKEGL